MSERPKQNRPAATANEKPANLLSSSKPSESAPAPTQGAENISVIDQAGQTAGQMPVKQTGPLERPPGDNENESKGAGISGGFPNAGGGPGTGLTTTPGVLGQTPAVHQGTGAISAGLPPGFSGARGKGQ
jgi:hypothetical protein